MPRMATSKCRKRGNVDEVNTRRKPKQAKKDQANSEKVEVEEELGFWDAEAVKFVK